MLWVTSMALLQINSTATPDPDRLAQALTRMPTGKPVIVMIHGFKFSPDHPGHCPHAHILAERPSTACWKARSWPRHLRLDRESALGIAFAWPARGTIWDAYRRAPAAARALSEMLKAVHRLDPARPVHIVAHSLGARVALLALRDLPAGSIDRLILMAAAVFRFEAKSVMASPAGQTAEVFSILGRENTLFDLLLRLAFPQAGPTTGRRGPDAPNWLDLRCDAPHTLNTLRGIGHRITAPKVRICHWSGYLRPGIFGLYRALLYAPRETPLPHLRRLLTPPRAQPRFRPRLPLPFWLRPSS